MQQCGSCSDHWLFLGFFLVQSPARAAFFSFFLLFSSGVFEVPCEPAVAASEGEYGVNKVDDFRNVVLIFTIAACESLFAGEIPCRTRASLVTTGSPPMAFAGWSGILHLRVPWSGL